MPLFRNGKFLRTDIWREGKWLDLWSVVHFLTGVSLGLGISFFRFGTTGSIVIAFLLLVAYELWEALVKIEETPQNRFMDVVVGMTSFLPAFLILVPSLSSFALILTSGLVLTLNILLSIVGWQQSRKAAELEAKVRRDLRARRTRFIERRLRRRAQRSERRMGR